MFRVTDGEKGSKSIEMAVLLVTDASIMWWDVDLSDIFFEGHMACFVEESSGDCPVSVSGRNLNSCTDGLSHVGVLATGQIQKA